MSVSYAWDDSKGKIIREKDLVKYKLTAKSKHETVLERTNTLAQITQSLTITLDTIVGEMDQF